MSTPSSSPPALIVSPPAGGFDRAGLREVVKESGLGMALHRLVRAPFGHTVLTLRALDAVIDAGDLALQAGEALQGALLEDLARSGSLALPEPMSRMAVSMELNMLALGSRVMVSPLARLPLMSKVSPGMPVTAMAAGLSEGKSGTTTGAETAPVVVLVMV